MKGVVQSALNGHAYCFFWYCRRSKWLFQTAAPPAPMCTTWPSRYCYQMLSMIVGLLQGSKASHKGMAWQRLLYWMAQRGRNHAALPIMSGSDAGPSSALLEAHPRAPRGHADVMNAEHDELPLEQQMPYTPVLSARASSVGSPSQQRMQALKWSPGQGHAHRQGKHFDVDQVDQVDQVWTGDTALKKGAPNSLILSQTRLGVSTQVITTGTSISGSLQAMHTGSSSRVDGRAAPAPPSAVGTPYYMAVTGTCGASSASQEAAATCSRPATSELLAFAPAQWLVTGTGTTASSRLDSAGESTVMTGRRHQRSAGASVKQSREDLEAALGSEEAIATEELLSGYQPRSDAM